MPEKQFQIHNTTRDPQTRLLRAQSPTTSKMTLLLGGGSIRVMRKRPVVVYEPVLQRLLPELQRLEKAGVVKVTTVKGERVDISTLKPLEKLPATPPLPHPPLDSAARDKQNVGQKVTKWADPKAIPRGAGVPMPKAVEDKLPDVEEAPELEELGEPEVPVEYAPVDVPSLLQDVPEEPSKEPQGEPQEEPAEAPPTASSQDVGGKRSRKHRR